MQDPVPSSHYININEMKIQSGLYRNIKLEEVRQWGKRAVNDDGEANRMLRQLLERQKHLKEKDNISALYFGYGKREGKGKV